MGKWDKTVCACPQVSTRVVGLPTLTEPIPDFFFQHDIRPLIVLLNPFTVSVFRIAFNSHWWLGAYQNQKSGRAGNPSSWPLHTLTSCQTELKKGQVPELTACIVHSSLQGGLRPCQVPHSVATPCCYMPCTHMGWGQPRLWLPPAC